MKIHEFQAKELLKKYGVSVPAGFVTDKSSEVKSLIAKLPTKIAVVKAQIHAGGRGKGGGVKVCKKAEDAEAAAKAILGMQLVTHQTGPEGQRVKKILIEQGMNIARELYLAITLDRSYGKLTFISSTEGGMDIEEVAASHPEKIIKTRIDVATGLTQAAIRKMAQGLLIEKALLPKFSEFLHGLYKAYMQEDCSLLEINPLVITKEGELFALDCKINLDDNALGRHPDLVLLRDEDEEDPLEREASKYGLNYIKLDGNVGCMVNGAGLAMATMDIIKFCGGRPANFLDVGGGANVETVANAFRIITQDKNVKAILINIFGGIVRCDRVAQGVLDAMKIVPLKVPLVVRLSGTNASEAHKLLADSGIKITVAKGLKDAAEKVVKALPAGA